jgi:hypothetical protein
MAGTLASKLQLKPGQAVRALSAPDGMDLDLPAVSAADDRPSGAPAPATLVFVTTFAEAEERVAPAVEAAPP